MATVEKFQITRDMFQLELSPEEAGALAQVLAATGGPPASSRRGLTQPIFDALIKAGAEYYTVGDTRRDLNGSLVFETREVRP